MRLRPRRFVRLTMSPCPAFKLNLAIFLTAPTSTGRPSGTGTRSSWRRSPPTTPSCPCSTPRSPRPPPRSRLAASRVTSTPLRTITSRTPTTTTRTTTRRRSTAMTE
ncbi:hypothetical protein F5X68DRAFT_196561, partial [Plectosphaerella plurivora]